MPRVADVDPEVMYLGERSWGPPILAGVVCAVLAIWAGVATRQAFCGGALLVVFAIVLGVYLLDYRSWRFWVKTHEFGFQHGRVLKKGFSWIPDRGVQNVHAYTDALGIVLGLVGLGYYHVAVQQVSGEVSVMKYVADGDLMAELIAETLTHKQRSVDQHHERQAVAAAATVATAVASVLQCPSCGMPQPASTKFCSSCGAQVASTCPQCGTGFTGRFCPECGASTVSSAAVDGVLP